MKMVARSRHKPQPGDVFAMLLLDDRYLYGRVVSIDAGASGMADGVMIYVYRARSQTLADVPNLSPNDLLIPPQFVNRLGWTRGYFVHVRAETMKDSDRLSAHCFLDPNTKKYVDEHGKPVAMKTEPVGFAALGNYRTVDDAVSRALGIPLSVD